MAVHFRNAKMSDNIKSSDLIVRFTNAKVSGSPERDDLVALFHEEHFVGYCKIKVVAASNATVELVINADKNSSKLKRKAMTTQVIKAAKAYSDIHGNKTPFEIRAAECGSYKKEIQRYSYGETNNS